MTSTDIWFIIHLNDFYQWIYLLKKDYLFYKSLNKHLIKAYINLYNAVNVCIKAISHINEVHSQQNDHDNNSEVVRLKDRLSYIVSFAVQIQELKTKNAWLQAAAKYWQTEVKMKFKMRKKI